MSDQGDKPQSAYLERVNADLSRSLRRCHALVDDYRAHLHPPANSNQPPFMLGEDGEQDEPDG